MKIEPENYSAWLCWAITLSDAGIIDKAMELYKKAIEIDPIKPNAYILLANILTNEKRYEEAIELYKSAIRLVPAEEKRGRSILCVFIANAYMLLEDIHNAIDYYRKALKEAPENNEVRLIYVEIMNAYITRKVQKQ